MLRKGSRSVTIIREREDLRGLHKRVWRANANGLLVDRHRIQNHACYRDPATGETRPRDLVLRDIDVAPYGWDGNWDFLAGVTGAAGQSWVGLRGSPGIPFWGIRRTHKAVAGDAGDMTRSGTGSWINWRVYGGNTVAPTWNYGERWIEWDGTWPGARLRVTLGVDGAQEAIYTQPRGPVSVTYTALVPPGHTLDDSTGVIRILFEGVEQFHARPYNVYKAGSADTENIASTVELDGTVELAGRTFPIVRFSISDTSHLTGALEIT